MIAVWIAVLLLAVWAAHWGAERLASPLKKLRKQWGFSVAAGGSFIGIAAAAPEIGINTSSAVRGVSDIGLGAMLGANIIAIPVMVTTAYLATRRPGVDEGHERHRERHIVAVDENAVTVQALPYLGILLVFAAVTVPAPWRGLQPIDGGILLIAYLAYLVQALVRGRERGDKVEWQTKEKWMAAAGVGSLAVGAYFTVLATEKIIDEFGIPGIIGGLFIAAPAAALPEIFATRSVARSGQVTSAVTSVIGDHVVTLTLAFVPLTIISADIQNFRLFWVSLVFVAVMAALYAGLIQASGSRDRGFGRWSLLAFAGAYALYIAILLFWVQPFGR